MIIKNGISPRLPGTRYFSCNKICDADKLDCFGPLALLHAPFSAVLSPRSFEAPHTRASTLCVSLRPQLLVGARSAYSVVVACVSVGKRREKVRWQDCFEMEPDSQKNRQPRRSALTSALEELALQSDAHAEDEVRAMRPHESRARLELRPLSALPPPCKKQLIF